MGVSLVSYLLMDVDSFNPPFGSSVSWWSLENDYGFSYKKDQRFISAITSYQLGMAPLIPPRGLPVRVPNEIRNGLDGLCGISYLTVSELKLSLEHAKLGLEDVVESVRMVVSVMEAAEVAYGRDRVLFVFGFS